MPGSGSAAAYPAAPPARSGRVLNADAVLLGLRQLHGFVTAG